MLDQQKAEAQQVLDDLFSEHVLHFKLLACVIEPIGGEEYIVRFHDRRLPAIDVSWAAGQSFRDVFRDAMLQRMERMNARRSAAA